MQNHDLVFAVRGYSNMNHADRNKHAKNKETIVRSTDTLVSKVALFNKEAAKYKNMSSAAVK